MLCRSFADVHVRPGFAVQEIHVFRRRVLSVLAVAGSCSHPGQYMGAVVVVSWVWAHAVCTLVHAPPINQRRLRRFRKLGIVFDWQYSRHATADRLCSPRTCTRLLMDVVWSCFRRHQEVLEQGWRDGVWRTLGHPVLQAGLWAR